MKNITYIILLFVIFNSSNQKKQIIGTWVCTEDSNWKLKFTTEGKCYQYYTNQPTDEFTYSIEQEVSESDIEHSQLKLIATNNTSYDIGQVINYSINGLSTTKMTLATFTNKVDYSNFTKQ